MAKVETGLTLKGNAEFGKKLMEAAVSEHREKFQKKVVGYVQTMMQQLELMRKEQETMGENIQLIENKLRAVENGEFVLNTAGDVVYEDKDLQKNYAPSTGQCKNCGYVSGAGGRGL